MINIKFKSKMKRFQNIEKDKIEIGTVFNSVTEGINTKSCLARFRTCSNKIWTEFFPTKTNSKKIFKPFECLIVQSTSWNECRISRFRIQYWFSRQHIQQPIKCHILSTHFLHFLNSSCSSRRRRKPMIFMCLSIKEKNNSTMKLKQKKKDIGFEQKPFFGCIQIPYIHSSISVSSNHRSFASLYSRQNEIHLCN